MDPRFRDHVRYRFRYCVEVDVRTRLAAETWRVSLDDRLTDIETASEIERGVRGHVWMGSQELYPGGRVIEGSERARVWANAIGIDFHEIVIESNEQTITLIVSDLEVTGVDP